MLSHAQKSYLFFVTNYILFILKTKSKLSIFLLNKITFSLRQESSRWKIESCQICLFLARYKLNFKFCIIILCSFHTIIRWIFLSTESEKSYNFTTGTTNEWFVNRYCPNERVLFFCTNIGLFLQLC